MLVPLPSGSWLSPGLYWNEVRVRLSRVKVTLLTPLLRLFLEIVHNPLAEVTQEPLAEAPLLHDPLTVTPLSGESLPS